MGTTLAIFRILLTTVKEMVKSALAWSLRLGAHIDQNNSSSITVDLHHGGGNHLSHIRLPCCEISKKSLHRKLVATGFVIAVNWAYSLPPYVQIVRVKYVLTKCQLIWIREYKWSWLSFLLFYYVLA